MVDNFRELCRFTTEKPSQAKMRRQKVKTCTKTELLLFVFFKYINTATTIQLKGSK